LRHVIHNWKIEKKKNTEYLTDEVLVLNFWVDEIREEGYILVGGNNRNIQAYSIRNATLEGEMSGHTDSVTCMAIEGYLLFTGSDDGTILHWDLKRFTKIGMIGRHEERK